MTPVPADPARHILRLVRRKEPGIVEFRLRPLPHVESFVVHQDTHFVAKIQQPGRRRIVGGPQRVHAHLLHQGQLPPGGFFVECRAKGPQIVVQAHAFQLHNPSVQQESLIRRKRCGAQPEPFFARLFAECIPQRIQHRMINIPRFRVLQAQGQFDFSVFAFRFPAGDLPAGSVRHRTPEKFPLRFGGLGTHGQRPAVPGLLFRQIETVRHQMVLRQFEQKHVPEDAAARIPSAVGAPVADVHQNFIPFGSQFSGQLRRESRVSVGVAADHIPVQQHVAVHIHAVKIKQAGFRDFLKTKLPPIPGVRGFIKIPMLPNQPVVGKIHLLPV